MLKVFPLVFELTAELGKVPWNATLHNSVWHCVGSLRPWELWKLTLLFYAACSMVGVACHHQMIKNRTEH
eukprot:5878637-Amphidinium_carterae.1